MDLLKHARVRARQAGLDFDLEVADIVIPDRCPALGLPLRRATGHADWASPTLDRIDSRKGYVRGNVAVISHRANSLKSDATAAELRGLLAYVTAFGGS